MIKVVSLVEEYIYSVLSLVDSVIEMIKTRVVLELIQ